ncbi:phosphatidylserine decarboxylase 2 [Actinidia rufa]|uniref:Phosphatidylserine decarboxylase 2 n=1 Tax=Actinidia rufa TaxID=165716 RepID=A0A7J0ERQ9_9ERIC|nr:phosphatidylserine decarboxylase 2 [Actinidia rufa]
MGQGSSKSESSDEFTDDSKGSPSRLSRLKHKLHNHRPHLHLHRHSSSHSQSKLLAAEDFAGIALVKITGAEMKFKDKWLACVSFGEQTFRTDVSDQLNTSMA